MNDDLKKIEDCGKAPTARFGHSLNLINKTTAVLFGGAIGDIKNFQFSNETFIYNLNTKIWMEANLSFSSTPEPRAAHAAASDMSNHLLIHSGSMNQSVSNIKQQSSLSEDDLWVFTFDADNEGEFSSTCVWKKVITVGQTPGRRYGHSMCYIDPFYVLFGGNYNSATNNELWIICLESLQISWKKVQFKGDSPSPRIYHSVAKSFNTMILFGGRDRNELPLGDIWKLQCNKGVWSWEQLVSESSTQMRLTARYNHSIVFYGPLLIIFGGRARNIQEKLPIEVFDVEKKETFQFLGIGRYRQSVLIKDTSLYIYGGFQPTNPSYPLGNMTTVDLISLFNGSLLYERFVDIGERIKNAFNTKVNAYTGFKDKIGFYNFDINGGRFKLSAEAVVGKSDDDPISLNNNLNLRTNSVETYTQFSKIDITKLPDETKRIGMNKVNSQLQQKRIYSFEVVDKFIDKLLRQFDWFSDEVAEIHKQFPFDRVEMETIIREAKPIISNDPVLIRIRSPCKIFGNILGQYRDLMRYFESFGHPNDETIQSDMYKNQYVFLGDFVDRGYFSLEVLFLLLSLKIKYPNYIYIIRGHHEDISVNAIYGLGKECKDRIPEIISKEDSIFMQINNLFTYLPLGVLIDEQILCVHGGIGKSINSLDDIELINRPVIIPNNIENSSEITSLDMKICDLLYSEYCEMVEDVSVSKRGKNVYYFGEKRLNKFLASNCIHLLINSHTMISEGIRSFCNDKIITVFSASNYMDKYNNIGGMLQIAKKTTNRPVQILPKLINVFMLNNPAYHRSRPESPQVN